MCRFAVPRRRRHLGPLTHGSVAPRSRVVGAVTRSRHRTDGMAPLSFATEITWYGTGIDIHHMEGAFAQVPDDATAFPNRTARYWLNVYGFWQDPAEDERFTAFARRAHAIMEPYADTGQYVNFLGFEDGTVSPDVARQTYGMDKHQRLVELKNRYDPENIFRLNHNIVPTAT